MIRENRPLQSSPFELTELNSVQKALTTWLYCRSAKTTQSGVDLIDKNFAKLLPFEHTSSLSFSLMSNAMLKESYIKNFQLELGLSLGQRNNACGDTNITLQSVSIATNQTAKNVSITTNQTAKNQFLDSKDLANPLSSFLPRKEPREHNQLLTFEYTEFYSAQWVLSHLQHQLQMRHSNVKRVMQQLFETYAVALVLHKKQFKGLTVTLSGRLSKSKKGMAKTVSKTIGRVPLSSLKQKVDYSQGHVTTKLGSLGIKVWITY